MGIASKLPVAAWVGIGYIVVLVVLLVAAPIAGAVWGGAGAVVLAPYLFIASARANNRRFQAAQGNLGPGERVRYSWKSAFPSMGEQWLVITTERLVMQRRTFLGMRVRSIPFSEIYLADTSERVFGVGAYGGGLIAGTTLSARSLEVDLVNGDVIKIGAPRPQVLRQQLVDAVSDWAQRQTP